ncbi:MAG: bifunctional transaldolase/phosoglucose isomerase [Bacteroidetes bacterium]|nr:bifunctional transaldolase/phosoglucose isomerase [Bacteroidota bacterium]
MNTLIELLNYGQSYWLDNLTRGKIKNGELKKRVANQGLRGITSNPSIFNKAITNGTDYDKQIKQLVEQKKGVHEIYEALTIKDVQDACDILKPVYDSSEGVDGFISIEVSPYLARDTEGTMIEARRLFKEVNRPNCYIKIPGTPEGVPAIEQMLYEGINVNITLLFSIQSYEAVAYAYLNALERRVAENKPIERLRSVASFFLSRIDVLADQLLGSVIIPGKIQDNTLRPEQLFGKAAIANAKIAYQSFKKIFSGERWEKLLSHGAKVQRPLWASTSTKDPLYNDVKYVEPLIGPDTVNTLPDETIDAFDDHGKIESNTIEKDVDESYKVIEDLRKIGVDIDFVTTQLLNEAIQKFVEPYDNLMKNISQKRDAILGERIGKQKISFGKSKADVSAAMKSLNEKQFTRRLFAKDPHLWSDDPEQIKEINIRLGWLDSMEYFLGKFDEVNQLVKDVKAAKYKYVVLLGMGGSSLCPEVSKDTFGSKPGYPELHVLDNTDPAAVKEVQSKIDLSKTLFIVSSKSGTTLETSSFEHYFYEETKKIVGDSADEHFVAITDPGTSLMKEAQQKKYRQVFENPIEFGGRYSALSFFGLVPMALIGIDIKKILNNAHQMQLSCGHFVPAEVNPGVSLGIFLGINYKQGRDKVTFVMSKSISSFGLWVEQLIAESTGKTGKGLIPVESEKLGSLEDYSNDRIFVHVYTTFDDSKADEKKLAALEKTGHPIVRIEIKDKLALGAEYLRWEIATATAGAVIGINAFDQPNVAESKKNSEDLLKEWKSKGSFNEGEAIISKDGISIFCNDSAKWMFEGHRKSVKEFLNYYFKLSKSPDYISVLAYCLQTPNRNKLLQNLRTNLRDKFKVATTLGYGPRYLHSTGQLHKGGANDGVFILFTSDANEEVSIPGKEFGFATLQRAQALGDFRSLNSHDRRVVRVHLGSDTESGLKKLLEFLK